MFYSKMTNNHKIWLEANTERSESNPGRSLGISMTYSDCCLEDSTSPSEASAFNPINPRSKKTQW